MRIDLNGRTALVSGSTAGIGLAIAGGLAEAGAAVVVNGRTEERVENAVATVSDRAAGGAEVRGVAADLGTAEGCDALIDAAPDVDVLVNSVAVFEPRPVFEITDDDWLRFFTMNVMSGIRLSRHHVPRMVERGWGRVIFVASESAVHIPAEMVHYGMTKTAQLAVARGMAESIPASGVTINSVLPGPTLSEGVEGFLREMTGGRRGRLDREGRTRVRRPGAPELAARAPGQPRGGGQPRGVPRLAAGFGHDRVSHAG